MQIDNRTIKERLADFLAYKNIGQDKFAQLANLSRGFANNVGDSIRQSSLDKIKSAFPELNILWLTSGVGSMLDVHQESESLEMAIVTEEEYQSAIKHGFPLLPEVDFKFSAGQTQLICGSEDITRYWFLPDCKDCEGVAQVVGRSMSPTLPSGSWVALKRYSIPTDNPNAIPFGNIFGVVVEDKETGDYHGHIKILRRYKDSNLAAKYWIAHSINTEEFDDFDIEIARVKSLWIVKQHIVSDIL